MTSPNIVLAITGASGAVYAVRLLEVLVESDQHVHLVISPSARDVLQHELGLSIDLKHFQLTSLLFGDADSPARTRLPPALGEVFSGAAVAALGHTGKVTYHHYEDLTAPIASGSFITCGMVICPCSASTLGAIVHGTGNNLVHRAAGVHLKERRKLILVPRETPFSTIQLENMRLADHAGAVVLPAMPGFYHGVKSIRDLIDFVVARICDQLDIHNTLVRRWGAS